MDSVWSKKPLQPPYGELELFSNSRAPQFEYSRSLHPDCNQLLRAVVLFVLKRPHEFGELILRTDITCFQESLQLNVDLN
jgi:hypothetical protein